MWGTKKQVVQNMLKETGLELSEEGKKLLDEAEELNAEIGATGIYFIALSAAEMNYDQVLIK